MGSIGPDMLWGGLGSLGGFKRRGSKGAVGGTTLFLSGTSEQLLRGFVPRSAGLRQKTS